MSDDGLVKVEYTIDGEGKPDGGMWQIEIDEIDWDFPDWAKLAEEIAADHYEDHGPIGDIVMIDIYQGRWKATVKLEKYVPIVAYQAIEVTDDEDEED